VKLSVLLLVPLAVVGQAADLRPKLEQVMGPLPKRSATLNVQVLEEAKTAKYIRRKITYDGGDGDRVPAYLFLPTAAAAAPGKRAPAMLCLHQTTKIGKGEPAGIGGKPDLHYARELAERGYVAIAPDYPNFGDYQFDAYAKGYVSATMKGIVNHRRAVDLVVSLPQVDKRRIGAIGHSLGGHNSLFVAAFEPRIKAVVTSCGFNSFHKYMKGNLKGWSHRGYMPRIMEQFNADPVRMPFDFTGILAALAPRAVFVNAPVGDTNFAVEGVHDCLRAAEPEYRRRNAADKLVAVHPEVGHEFPPAIREQAYAFLDRVLLLRR
jgi:dienelactone hydrolase